MKNNNILSYMNKAAFAAILGVFLLSCGDKSQSVTSNSDEPKWVNSIAAGKEKANAMVVAVGSAKFLDGNIDYATNQATMNARIQIAQTVSVKVEQAIKDLAQSDGMKISENNLQAAKQKVELNLQQTQMVERWIDRKSNPQIIYVLVAMDKEAYEKALKGGEQVLNINADQARRLSHTVEELLQ
ncbi:LPP20 family lipoprotein [Helicobacter aurati]|nr:LPP20 family lipoprotein [Helicobacter aurati]